jgi:hypothetical protein
MSFPNRRVGVRLINVQNERMQLGNEFLNARRYDLIFQSPGMNTAVTVTTGVDGNLLSVRIRVRVSTSFGVDLASDDDATVGAQQSRRLRPSRFPRRASTSAPR